MDENGTGGAARDFLKNTGGPPVPRMIEDVFMIQAVANKRVLWRFCIPMVLATGTLLIAAASTHAQDAAPTTNPSVEIGPPARPTLLQLFQLAGPFMYPLAGCSILSVAIIIERFFALRRSQVIPRGFMPGLRQVFRDPQADREAAVNYCRSHDSPIARMIMAGIKRMPRGLSAAEKAIEDAGANEALKLRRYMRFLYAMGSVATLLGLIGTIAGMISAFMATATAGEGPGKVAALSTGIYEAMVNTFGGLAIAIVVTIFYYFFVGRIERLISELNDVLTQFSDDYGFNAEPDPELDASRM